VLTSQQLLDFNRDGYVIVRSLFRPEEVKLAEQIARTDRQIRQGNVMKDASGLESKLWIASDLKEDIFNAFAHDARIVNPTQQILGGPIYLWHYKMMMKEPRVGGAWEWHQDYGYWYNDGCLFPNLLSCMIGVNKATIKNGCLQVLRGSHLIGRIEHGVTGQQAGADSVRVEAAKKQLELVHVELDPGDALFFHCNILHASAQNRSEHPRWAFITCYNAMDNIPFRGGHGKPILLEAWDKDAVMRLGTAQCQALEKVTVRATI
jgi:ectoine hydroxylase